MKVPAEREVGYCPVVERTRKFGAEEKEKMVQSLREYEEFCEVKILTFRDLRVVGVREVKNQDHATRFFRP